MPYTVFISHSSQDMPLVRFIASQLQLQGIAPIIAQHVRPATFPQYLPEKIKLLIQESDCVVVLLTKSGVGSNWVHQEIGYSLDRKPLLPIAESDIPSEQLAFLQGAEYIPLHWRDVTQSTNTLLMWMNHLKVAKEESERMKVLGLFILGALALWSSQEEE